MVNSGNDDSEFTLNSLDTILKEKPDDVRLRVVSQFLHLITNGGFSKLAASELLASSVNKGPWHARVIRSWANQWLSNGQLSMSRRGHHAKIRSLLLHEDLKLNIIEYLWANKFKITIHQFIRFVEDEAIPAFGIEGKKNISRETAQKWLHHLG